MHKLPHELQTQSGTEGSDLRSELLKCLRDTKKNDLEWQDRMGRLVGLSFTRASQADTPIEEVLSLTALILRAQAAGCKDAKKRVLNLTRIRNGIPHDYTFPEGEEETLGQLRLLTKIKSSWCNEFIRKKLQESPRGGKVYDLYVIWASRNADSITDIFYSAVEPLLLSGCHEKVKLHSLRAVSNLAASHDCHEDRHAILSFEGLVQLALPLLRQEQLGQKIRAGLLDLLVKYSRRIMANCPGVPLSPDFLYSVKQISEIKLPKLSKNWEAELDYVAKVTISLLGSTLCRQEQSSPGQIRALIPMLASILPTFSSLLKKESERTPSLRSLTKENLSEKTVNVDVDTEARMAELLVRWFRFRTRGVMSEHDLNALNQDVVRIADSLRVRYIGALGDLVNFDPREHILASEVSQFHGKVEVVEPGVCQVREDGTQRVLIHAIVAPAAG